MKSNDSLFRKAYNNHHDKNGSDVSSTADSLMRSDIGDGVNLDGENFSNANGDGLNINLNDFPALFGDNCMLMMQQITGQNNPILYPGRPYLPQDPSFSGKSNANGDGMNAVADFIVTHILNNFGGCEYSITEADVSFAIFQVTQNENNANDPYLIGAVLDRYSVACDQAPGDDLSEFLFVECNTPYGDGSYCGEDFPGYTRYAEFNIINFLDNVGLFLNYPAFVDCMNTSLNNDENYWANNKLWNQLALRFRLIAQSIYKISDYTDMTALTQLVSNIKMNVWELAQGEAPFPMTNGVDVGSEYDLPLQTGESAGQPDCYAYPLHCLHNRIAKTERTLYNYILGEGTSPGGGTPTDGGSDTMEGGVLGNIIDVVSGTNPPNPYGNNQSIPSWITPNAPGLPDIEDCSGLTSQLYQMYSPYLTAYTPFNFNVDGGSISNILNQLEGQNIGFYLQEAMQSYDNYVSLVVAGLLCAAGMDENPSPSLDSFWNNLPENCQLQSYSGNGNDGANGEGVPPNEPIPAPAEDGGMVAPIDNSNIDTSATNKPLPFSNANGNNNQALIQQINYIKNWFKDNPIDRDMFASSESFEIYHIGNGEMGGGASSLYQMQSQAFDSNNPEISWSVDRFKSLQDWYKVGNFVEMFFGVFVRVANCLPTDVKNACTSLLQEIMARNTEFFIVETDEQQQFIDLFQELGMPIPPNFFREYTSLEYNELANQLAQSEGMIQGLTSQINTLNTQYMMVQNELNNIMNMMEYEQDNTDELEAEIAELMDQKAELEAQLVMFMVSLDQMQIDYMDVIEENGMLQAELGASNQLQMVLQDQFDTAVMNEMALQNMVEALQRDLQSSNAEIAQLQTELNNVIADLVTQISIGNDMQQVLQTQLADSQSEISQLTSQIADLQTTIAVQQGQIEANTINQQDVAYYENQISNLNQANQSLLLTIQEMEMQTGQTATDLGSGIVQVQGQIDMKTGKGTIQILKGKPQRPQRPVREKKPTISKDGKRLNFVAHNPMKDLNPWNYMDGEHRRFNNSYDLDN